MSTNDTTTANSDKHYPNPYDETLFHDHICKNCSVTWFCLDPLCDGGCCDPELCPDCEEIVGEFW